MDVPLLDYEENVKTKVNVGKNRQKAFWKVLSGSPDFNHAKYETFYFVLVEN